MELWLAEIRNPSWSHVHSPQFTPVAASETRHVNELNFCVSVYYYVGECVCVCLSWINFSFGQFFVYAKKHTTVSVCCEKLCSAAYCAGLEFFYTRLSNLEGSFGFSTHIYIWGLSVMYQKITSIAGFTRIILFMAASYLSSWNCY